MKRNKYEVEFFVVREWTSIICEDCNNECVLFYIVRYDNGESEIMGPGGRMDYCPRCGAKQFPHLDDKDSL